MTTSNNWSADGWWRELARALSSHTPELDIKIGTSLFPFLYPRWQGENLKKYQGNWYAYDPVGLQNKLLSSCHRHNCAIRTLGWGTNLWLTLGRGDHITVTGRCLHAETENWHICYNFGIWFGYAEMRNHLTLVFVKDVPKNTLIILLSHFYLFWYLIFLEQSLPIFLQRNLSEPH